MSAQPSRRQTDQRIGLLGGSFNPAHEGHLHISLLALDYLGLDELWWLVSPQNPLKPAHGMAAFEARLAGARDQADDPRIVVSDMERRLGTRYTKRRGQVFRFSATMKIHRSWRERRP